jgi:hypothetical protein
LKTHTPRIERRRRRLPESGSPPPSAAKNFSFDLVDPDCAVHCPFGDPTDMGMQIGDSAQQSDPLLATTQSECRHDVVDLVKSTGIIVGGDAVGSVGCCRGLNSPGGALTMKVGTGVGGARGWSVGTVPGGVGGATVG